MLGIWNNYIDKILILFICTIVINSIIQTECCARSTSPSVIPTNNPPIPPSPSNPDEIIEVHKYIDCDEVEKDKSQCDVNGDCQSYVAINSKTQAVIRRFNQTRCYCHQNYVGIYCETSVSVGGAEWAGIAVGIIVIFIIIGAIISVICWNRNQLSKNQNDPRRQNNNNSTLEEQGQGEPMLMNEQQQSSKNPNYYQSRENGQNRLKVTHLETEI